jgi:hypothetical protein
LVQFGIRIEFRDPETDAPESYFGSMMREGFRLPTLPSPGDGMMGLGYPVLPVAQVLHYPAPHWTNDGMEDGDGPDIDVIVHASASSLTEERIAEFEARDWKWHPARHGSVSPGPK